MHLKNVGVKIQKQTESHQTILKQDVLETGIKNLNGMQLDLVIRYMQYLMRISAVHLIG